MSRSNMFANIENEIKKLNKDDLINYSKEFLKDLIEPFTNNSKLFTLIVFQGMRFGLMGDGKINDVEKEFLKKWFITVLKVPYDEEAEHNTSIPIDEEDYKILEQTLSTVGKRYPTWGITYLKFILVFAYCDGVFEEDVAKRLDGIFGMTLLVDFFASGMSEVPKPTHEVGVSKIEKELLEHIIKTSGGPMKDIISKFPHLSKETIEEVLDSLANKGLIDKIENIINAPWYVSNDSVRDIRENNMDTINSKPNPKKEMDSFEIKEELLKTIQFLLLI